MENMKTAWNIYFQGSIIEHNSKGVLASNKDLLDSILTK
jgi:hypothetical protein